MYSIFVKNDCLFIKFNTHFVCDNIYFIQKYIMRHKIYTVYNVKYS